MFGSVLLEAIRIRPEGYDRRRPKDMPAAADPDPVVPDASNECLHPLKAARRLSGSSNAPLDDRNCVGS